MKRAMVMVPDSCNIELDDILERTGIKSRGAVVELLLARYKKDFVQAYLEFSNQE